MDQTSTMTVWLYTTESALNYSTTESHTQSKWIEDFEYYSEAYVQTGILIFGLIFNICNFIVLSRTKIGDTFRVCLLALTITDACACLFGAAQLVVESVAFRGVIIFGYWDGAALASHLLYYVFLMFLCTSSVYVILVGAVRAYMISKPYKSAKKLKANKLKKVCAAIFGTVAILFLPSPMYAMWQVCYAKDNTSPICIDYFKKLPKVVNMKYYFYGLSLIFGPFVIIANVVVLTVIRHALKKSQERSDRVTKKENKKQNYYKRLTKMLFVILIFDTIWLLPTCIQYLGLVFSPENTVFNSTEPAVIIFDIIAEILLLFRPTYNIFVYLTTNREYQRTFQSMFCPCMKVSESAQSVELDNSNSKNSNFINHINQENGKDSSTIPHQSDEEAVDEKDIYILPGDL